MLDCLIRILEPTPKPNTPNPILQHAHAMKNAQEGCFYFSEVKYDS